MRIAYENDCEELLATELLAQASQGALPELKVLQERYLGTTNQPKIPVRQHDTASYDQLLEGSWALKEVCHG